MGKKINSTAAFTTLFSLIILVEGVVRIINAISTGRSTGWESDSDTGYFPPVVLLIASIIEILAAIIGLLAGLLPLVYRVNNSIISSIALGVSFCLIFPWIVYCFAYPAYVQDNLDGSIHGPDYSESESDGLTVLGILGVAAYNGAAYAGQFLFIQMLLSIQKGDDEESHTQMFFRFRAVIFSFLLLLSGVCGLSFGSMVYDIQGDGQLAYPVVQVPWVVIYPEATITVGVITTLVGLISIFKSAAGVSAGTGFLGLLLTISFALQATLMVIVQLSIINSNFGVNVTYAGAQLAVLAFGIHLMPAYLDSMMGKSNDD